MQNLVNQEECQTGILQSRSMPEKLELETTPGCWLNTAVLKAYVLKVVSGH